MTQNRRISGEYRGARSEKVGRTKIKRSNVRRENDIRLSTYLEGREKFLVVTNIITGSSWNELLMIPKNSPGLHQEEGEDNIKSEVGGMELSRLA